ncbi:hypothetical protein DJ82_02085 [Halorubrum sp. Ib24]|uniref:hypothetical protein n=1 Tax=Halorubrum sp. Ib24 TaxID=1383850 RepID=UPI000B98A325|nr:hypothetical protein [Halorubrum sp. Ib24]OYR42819.1 hypothetical protein DJ82_02085 [Halorubrum sp. Ib24]
MRALSVFVAVLLLVVPVAGTMSPAAAVSESPAAVEAPDSIALDPVRPNADGPIGPPGPDGPRRSTVETSRSATALGGRSTPLPEAAAFAGANLGPALLFWSADAWAA